MLHRNVLLAYVLLIFTGGLSPLDAQDSSAIATPGGPRRGAQVLLPLGSMVVPGLGQYVEGATLAGAVYTSTAAAGLAVALGADAARIDVLARDPDSQLATTGLQTQLAAGYLSAWDSFQRAVPSLQREGKYEFLTTRETVVDLIKAPFDPEFLSRPTTWLHLAYTGLLAGIAIAGRDSDATYEPYRTRDAAFTAAISFNAGVGEEAAFRGWLLPLLYQNTGERFWLSNALQAGVFAGLHAPDSRDVAVEMAAWALYEGWLTRRNGWSIRESIFHHFWYDVFAITANFLTDERRGRIQLTLPTIRF